MDTVKSSPRCSRLEIRQATGRGVTLRRRTTLDSFLQRPKDILAVSNDFDLLWQVRKSTCGYFKYCLASLLGVYHGTGPDGVDQRIQDPQHNNILRQQPQKYAFSI